MAIDIDALVADAFPESPDAKREPEKPQIPLPTPIAESGEVDVDTLIGEAFGIQPLFRANKLQPDFNKETPTVTRSPRGYTGSWEEKESTPNDKLFEKMLMKRAQYQQQEYLFSLPHMMEQAKKEGLTGDSAKEWAINKANLYSLKRSDTRILEDIYKQTPDFKSVLKETVKAGLGKVASGVSFGTAKNLLKTMTPLEIYFATMPPEVQKDFMKKDVKVGPLNISMSKMVSAHQGAAATLETVPMLPWFGVAGKLAQAGKGALWAKMVKSGLVFSGVGTINKAIDPEAEVELTDMGREFVLGAALPLLNKIKPIGNIEKASSKWVAVSKLMGQSVGAAGMSFIVDYINNTLHGRKWSELTPMEKKNIYINCAMLGGFHLAGGKDILFRKAEAWKAKKIELTPERLKEAETKAREEQLIKVTEGELEARKTKILELEKKKELTPDEKTELETLRKEVEGFGAFEEKRAEDRRVEEDRRESERERERRVSERRKRIEEEYAEDIEAMRDEKAKTRFIEKQMKKEEVIEKEREARDIDSASDFLTGEGGERRGLMDKKVTTSKEGKTRTEFVPKEDKKQFWVDLDKMKEKNDKYGEREANRYIDAYFNDVREAVGNKGDVVRVNAPRGDELVVFPKEGISDAEKNIRLKNALDKFNNRTFRFEIFDKKAGKYTGRFERVDNQSFSGAFGDTRTEAEGRMLDAKEKGRGRIIFKEDEYAIRDIESRRVEKVQPDVERGKEGLEAETERRRRLLEEGTYEELEKEADRTEAQIRELEGKERLTDADRKRIDDLEGFIDDAVKRQDVLSEEAAKREVEVKTRAAELERARSAVESAKSQLAEAEKRLEEARKGGATGTFLKGRETDVRGSKETLQLAQDKLSELEKLSAEPPKEPLPEKTKEEQQRQVDKEAEISRIVNDEPAVAEDKPTKFTQKKKNAKAKKKRKENEDKARIISNEKINEAVKTSMKPEVSGSKGEPPAKKPPRRIWDKLKDDWNKEDPIVVSESRWDKIKQQLYDRFTPLMPKEGDPNYDVKLKTYKQARLLAGKVIGKTSIMMDDLYNKTLGDIKGKDIPILNQMYKMYSHWHWDRLGKTTSGITERLAAENLIRIRNEIGREKYNLLRNKIEQIAKIHNDTLLDMLVTGEVITPKLRDILKERYPVYMRTELLDGSVESIMNRVTSVREAIAYYDKGFLKEKKGTEYEISDDLLELTKRSIIQKTVAAQKQHLINNILQEYGQKVGIMIDYVDRAETTPLRHGQVPKEFVRMNINTRIPRTEDIKWVRDNFEKRLNKIAKNEGIEITNEWIQDNIRLQYAVPEGISNMMKGMNNESIDIITRTMGAYNNIFRMAATTWRLPFVITNPMRDVWNGFFMSRVHNSKVSRLSGLAQGFKEATLDAFGFHSELARQFKEAGTGFGGIATALQREVRIPIRLLKGKNKIVRIGKDGVYMPLTLIEKFAQIGENAVRMGEFIRAKSAGLSESEAAFMARDLTVDFAKRGDAMKIFNMWIPFLNASMQGNINYLRFMRDKPAVAAARLSYLTVLPFVALKMWNASFDDDADITDYIKRGYWYWRVPDFEALQNGEFKGKVIKTDEGDELPLLFTFRKAELASWLTGIAEPVVDHLLREDKEKLPEIKNKTLTSMLLTSAVGEAKRSMFGMIPPAISTQFEIAGNYMAWADSPIVPHHLENVEPKYQSRPSTTNIPRRIGEKLNLSPAKIEYAITSLFPAGKQALALASPLFESDTPGAQNYGISSSNLELFSKYVPVIKIPTYKQRSEEMYGWKEEDETKQKTASKLLRDADYAMLTAKNDMELKKAEGEYNYVLSNYKPYITWSMRKSARESNKKRLAGKKLGAKERVWQKLSKPQKKRYTKEYIELGAKE